MGLRHLPADPNAASPFDRYCDYYIVEDYDMNAHPDPSPELLDEIQKASEEVKEMFRKAGVLK